MAPAAQDNRLHNHHGSAAPVSSSATTTTQRYSSGFPSTAAPQSVASNNQQNGATPAQNQSQLVQATCAKCSASLGVLLNAWVPVTNTYYLQSQTSYRAIGLEVKGEPKPPGNSDSALAGCLIQALMCNSCREVLAFTCAKAPDNKSGFRGRQFFKLSKITLTSATTKKIVEAITEKTNPAPMAVAVAPEARPAHHHHQVLDNTHPGTVSPGPDQSTEEFTDADRIAVQGTNDGSMTWKEAHEDWSLKTQRTMSPGAFGKRILNFGGGLRPKPPGPPPSDRPLLQAAPMQSNGVAPNSAAAQQAQQTKQMIAKTQQPLQPQQQQSQQPQQQHQHQQQHQQHHHQQQQQPQQPMTHQQQQAQYQQPQQTQPNGSMQQYRSGPVQQHQHHSNPFGFQQFDSLEHQRQDIDRIDGAVAQLQISIEGLTRSMDAVKKEMQKRPTSAPTIDDQSAFDLLSETVSNMATKTGELDGLKIQMEALKRRIKRLEDGGGGGSVASVELPQTNQPPFPGPGYTPQSINNKRPAVPQFAEAPGQSYKRPRISDAELQIIDSRGGTPVVSYPSAYTATNGESHDSWISQSQRALAARGDLSTPGRRGPGRPRKYPTPDLGTPVWEQEGWNPQVDADGHYHQLGHTPSTDERGRIIRRGSLGGSIHMSGKRTRQRPIRNSEGVLIRKDGKPDQRSISSAQNLKKFYNKKMAQLIMEKTGSSQDGSGGGEGEEGKVEDMEGNSNSDRNGSQDPMVVDMDSDIEGDDDGEDYDSDHDNEANHDDANGDAEMETSNSNGQPHSQPQPTAPATSTQPAHNEIMKKMFPNGITGEATRLDQAAAELFEPAKSQVAPLAKMQPREEVVKKEVLEGMVPVANGGGGGVVGTSAATLPTASVPASTSASASVATSTASDLSNGAGAGSNINGGGGGGGAPVKPTMIPDSQQQMSNQTSLSSMTPV